MKLLITHILILSFFSLASLSAQQGNISALQQRLSTTQGTEKVDLLNQLSKQLQRSQPAQATTYAEEALDQARDLGYQSGIMVSAYYLGIAERDEKDFRRAIRYTEEGLLAAKAQNDGENELLGYKIMQTIYQLYSRPKKLKEYQEKFDALQAQLSLAETSQQLKDLEKDYKDTEESLLQTQKEKEAVAQEKDAVVQEKEAVLGVLKETEAEKLRKEAELSRVRMEAAELEKETALLEKEAALKELELKEERNMRNLALALAGVLLFLFLAGWQRYRFIRQRKLADIEKQRVQRLQEVDRLKDQFLANTSHELRTPLNGIIGIAEWLHEQDGDLESKILNKNLSLIISSGRRLNNLVNDIMDFSRLKNAELQLNSKPLHLQSLAEVILRINEPLLQGKKIALFNEVPVDLPPAHGDEDRLQQILQNLVGNAIKFSNKGTIAVSAAEQEDELIVAVSDMGIGISEEKKKGIFQAFHQADGSTIRTHQGTGLGLSITKYLVELHGGRIWVESKEGKGSTFYFSIPKSDQPVVTKSEAAAKVASSVLSITKPTVLQPGPSSSVLSDQRINILIVDDEPINQHVLRNHLSSNHYRISTALNGEEALAILESEGPFDLVLLDIMMPRMSGYEVCERIRQKHLPSELPIIMVTAKNLVQDLVNGLDVGANDYLAKPFSKDELLARVKTQINLNHINRATGRFVPNAFLRTLGKENITEVKLGDLAEREVTVFFSDIRDYTRLSESMTPEENFKFVNAYNQRLGPVISKHKGFINQYLGDAIMAIFLDNPVNTLRASIEMQKITAIYNAERVRRGRMLVTTGMGFHTGKLIMGIIGDHQRMDAATISDTVNTASRIENLNKYFGTNILLSEDSLKAFQDAEEFNFRYLGLVQMKGKNLPVGVYECIDGDHDLLRQKKLESINTFNEGVQTYLNKDFDKAIALFQSILRINPDDATANVFLKKAKHYLHEGVPADWQGVEKMKTK